MRRSSSKPTRRWYVGPDNGLFELVTRRADRARSWEISAPPEAISASFHGRDLFAPVAGLLARGDPPAGRLRPDGISRRPDWPDDLPEIVYIDRFGNAMTGLRAALIPDGARLAAAGRVLARRRTFSDVPAGEAFWYENSNGLAEIAVNAGRADAALGLAIGTPVSDPAVASRLTPLSRRRADDLGARRNPELATSLQPVKHPHGDREDDKHDQHDEAERAHQVAEHGAECVSEEIAERRQSSRPTDRRRDNSVSKTASNEPRSAPSQRRRNFVSP